ncbi:hypothetical protein J6590_034079 [Homalodisca vitripennis]|nr:hypothetical protein J6590_034079 [Homalodisca vitripennis]
MFEVRAKKPSLILNLENGSKVTSEPPPTAGQAGCLQGQDRSAGTRVVPRAPARWGRCRLPARHGRPDYDIDAMPVRV